MVGWKTPRSGRWIGSRDGLTIRCLGVETGPRHLVCVFRCQIAFGGRFPRGTTPDGGRVTSRPGVPVRVATAPHPGRLSLKHPVCQVRTTGCCFPVTALRDCRREGMAAFSLVPGNQFLVEDWHRPAKFCPLFVMPGGAAGAGQLRHFEGRRDVLEI